jgi:protein-S-isoprenylcysteine O-methyltransferase Ste14
MRSLELRIPPVAVVIVLGGAMCGGAFFLPSLTTDYPGRWIVAILIAVVGMAIAFAGVAEFRRAQTTVDPMNPEKSSAVVTSGVYRFTRNPMYLGFLIVLVGWTAFLANLAAVIGPILFVAYMHRFQILPEERILRAHFGAPYEDYLKNVRRWI